MTSMNTAEMKEIFIDWLNPTNKLEIQVQTCWVPGEINVDKCKTIRWEDLLDEPNIVNKTPQTDKNWRSKRKHKPPNRLGDFVGNKK